jgi:hypothetical protein
MAAGSKWQRDGSDTSPSFNPSCASQACRTAACSRSSADGVSLASTSFNACATRTACAERADQSSPGDPATMPS